MLVIAGVWLAAAEILPRRLAKSRSIVAGLTLVGAGVLLIIATRWGQFG